jgi:hypothetical protein
MTEVKTKVLFLLIVAAALLAVLAGCNQLKKLNIGGTFAGTITDKNGTPQGFVKVELIDVGTNKVVMTQNAQDNGRFLFEQVPRGKYRIRVSTVVGRYPDDPKVYTLGMGRTLDVTVVVDTSQAPKAPTASQ